MRLSVLAHALERRLGRHLRGAVPVAAPRSREAVRFLAANGDAERYLRENPDVKAMGRGPVEHWLSVGRLEGRRFPGVLVVETLEGPGQECVRVPQQGENEAWLCPDPGFILEVELERFIEQHGDKRAYLAMNDDVREAGIEPVRHWLESGLSEGRVFPGVDTRLRCHDEATGWSLLRWRGEPVAVRVQRDLPEQNLAEIFRQAKHEPALLAPGQRSIRNLRRIEASRIFDRDGLDCLTVFDLVGRPSVVVLISGLGLGGAEKYASDLIDVLIGDGGRDLVVLVTDQTEAEAKRYRGSGILEALVDSRIVFLRDHLRGGVSLDETMVARLLQALEPQDVLVVNSEVALATIRGYGRRLASISRLWCTFFALSPGTFGARFVEDLAPHVRFLTDNQRAAAELVKRAPYGAFAPVCIAPRIRSALVASEGMIEQYAARRAGRPHGEGTRWLWISRIERQKGTEVLRELARILPDDRFEVFGEVQEESALHDLDASNIVVHRPIDDVAAIDPSVFHGFLFTSLFEGMPNIVLEMAGLGLPLILADVGGLRETFGDDHAVFVQHDDELLVTATAFAEALTRTRDFSADEVAERLAGARAALVARHSPEVFSHDVMRILKEGSE